MRIFITGLCVTLAGLSCDTSSSRDEMVVRRDSAGVRVIENLAPRWAAGDEWTISDRPVVKIGTVAGDPRYEFHRVTDVLRLPDGRIVAANDGNHQLRFFDANGMHLGDVGRQGDGPGEFQFLFRIWMPTADSIAAFDNRHVRLSIFTTEGELVRSVPMSMDPGTGRPTAQTGFGDGSILTVTGVGRLTPQEGRIEGGRWIYSRYSADGELLNTISEGPGGARWGRDYRGGFSFPYLPFVIGIPPADAARHSVYFGEGTSFEVAEHDLDGTLARLLRWNAAYRTVSSEVVARYRNHRTSLIEDANGRRQMEQWLTQIPFPDRMPVYQQLKVDMLGNLWVEQYRALWEREPQWWIFNAEGVWLGALSTPSGMRIDEIGPDYLLGVWRDEDQVEYVVMYSLRRRTV